MEEQSRLFLQETLNSKNLSVHALAGDASTRRYYRVVVDETSTVLMEWDPFENPDQYPFLNVQRFFREIGIHVPRVLSYSEKLGLVLLEDLGDLTLERRFWETQNKQLSVPFYEQAIDELIKIQFDATPERGPCVAFNVVFDTEKFMWEVNYALKYLIAEFGQYQLSEKSKKEVLASFQEICEKLDQEPKRLAHRDYHSRNLMIKFNTVRVIDFQDARMGPIQYDLVSLIRDSYVDMPTSMTRSLLQYYTDQTQERGHRIPLDDHFYEIYELQTIQRCFKACGSFASFLVMRSDDRYLKYIKDTLKTVLLALNNFPKYRIITEVILDSGLLDKK